MEAAGPTGVRWTTDAALRLTSIEGSALAERGIDGARLIGLPLSLLVCGGASHPLLDAHRAALDGDPAPLEFAWGRWRLIGALVPERDARRRVIGCTGLAHLRDTYSPAERQLAPEWTRVRRRATAHTHRGDRARALAEVVAQLEAEAAVLWRIRDDGRLAVAAACPADAAVDAALEPFAWAAANGLSLPDADRPRAWHMPVRTNDGTRFMLTVLPGPTAPPSAPSPALRSAARALGDVGAPTRLSAARAWLAMALAPLRSLFWAC